MHVSERKHGREKQTDLVQCTSKDVKCDIIVIITIIIITNDNTNSNNKNHCMQCDYPSGGQALFAELFLEFVGTVRFHFNAPCHVLRPMKMSQVYH